MKTINNFLYLPVPMGSRNFRIEPDEFDSRGFAFKDLPKGEWEIVSLASEMTEEVAKGLVELTIFRIDVPVRAAGFLDTYRYTNYLNKFSSNPNESFFTTALESFHSLMEANEMDLTKSDYVILKRK